MIRFRYLSLRNFLGWGDVQTIINLDQPGLTSITGENLDDTRNGKTSNGCGKTSIINGLTYACYDDLISNVDSKDGIINNVNKKNMEVMGAFSTITGTYITKRIRKGKGGNGVHLYEARAIEVSNDVLLDAMTAMHSQYDAQDDVMNTLGFKDITPASVDATNKLLEQIIGIPYDMFIYIITISYSSRSFFDLKLRSTSSEVGQVEIIEKLFDMTRLTEKAEALKIQMKATDEALSKAKQKYDLLEGERERHNQQLVSAKTRIESWNTNHDLEISRLEQVVAEIVPVDYEVEGQKIQKYYEFANNLVNTKKELTKAVANVESADQKIKDWSNTNTRDILTTERKLDEANSIDVDAEYAGHEKQAALDIEISEANTALLKAKQVAADISKEVVTSKKTITACEQIISKSNGEIEHLKDNTCPYCSQPFVDTKTKIAENEARIKESQEAIAEENEVLSTLEVKFNEYNDGVIPTLTRNITELQKQRTAISSALKTSSIKALMEISKDIETLTERLTTLQNDVNPHTDTLAHWNDIVAELEEIVLEDSVTAKALAEELMFTDIQVLNKLQRGNESNIEALEKAKVAVNPHLEALEELEAIQLDPIDMKDINELVNIQEHQKFLQKLLTKRDSFIRKNLLNTKIPYLNARFAYHANELGLKHTVEFTNELSAEISQFGNSIGYGNLSHGQQARVNLALSFAFRDVLQNAKNYVNICLLDEALDDGLDTVGIQAAFKALKRQAEENNIALFIITHRDEVENMFDKKLTIQFQNGFSQLKS
jgi:DNA repair exonuclease SbcCD ATPase subunit